MSELIPKRLTRRRALKTLAMAPASAALAARSTEARQRGGPRVVVVGAGAFGGWTAYNLLRRGARVTLVDVWGPGNARASSGGESRVIRGLYGADKIYVELVARSYDLWREAEKRFRAKLFVHTGGLWMFGADDRYARNAVPIMKEHGLAIEELTVAETRKRYPLIQLDDVRSVFFEADAGYLLARRACAHVVDAFIAEGGTYRQAQARPGSIENESLDGVSLSDGSRLRADAYLFACGPWLGELFPEAVGDRVLPTRQEILYFGAPSETAEAYAKLPMWADFQERLFYGIPGVEARGFKVADDTRGPSFDPTDGERTASSEAIAAARAFLRRRFPGLKDAPLTESRVCQYENSPDGHFIFDRHPEASDVWLMGGGSGHGFKHGPALGEHATRRILGEAEIEPFFALARLGDSSERSTQFDQKPKKR